MLHNGNADRCRRYRNKKKLQQQQQGETSCIDNININIVQNDSLHTIRLSQQTSTSNAVQKQQQQGETTCIDNININIVQNDSLPTIRLSQQPSTSNAGLMLHNGNADRCRRYRNKKKLQQPEETTCIDNINFIQNDNLPTIRLLQQPSTSNVGKRKKSSTNIANLEHSKRIRTTSLQNNGIGTETLPQEQIMCFKCYIPQLLSILTQCLLKMFMDWYVTFVIVCGSKTI